MHTTYLVTLALCSSLPTALTLSQQIWQDWDRKICVTSQQAHQQLISYHGRTIKVYNWEQ